MSKTNILTKTIGILATAVVLGTGIACAIPQSRNAILNGLSSHSQVYKDMSKENTNLKEEKEDLLAQKITYEALANTYSAQVTTLTGEKQTLESDISSLRVQLSTSETDKAEIQTQLDEKTSRLAEVNASIRTLNSTITYLNTQIYDILDNLGDISSEYATDYGIGVTIVDENGVAFDSRMLIHTNGTYKIETGLALFDLLDEYGQLYDVYLPRVISNTSYHVVYKTDLEMFTAGDSIISRTINDDYAYHFVEDADLVCDIFLNGDLLTFDEVFENLNDSIVYQYKISFTPTFDETDSSKITSMVMSIDIKTLY